MLQLKDFPRNIFKESCCMKNYQYQGYIGRPLVNQHSLKGYPPRIISRQN